MTQDPSFPAQPPFPPDLSYYQPIQDPRGPGRKAGLMMILMAVLIILFGGCLGLVPLIPLEELTSPETQPLRELLSDETNRMALMFGGAVLAAFGLAFLIVGLFVRRGGLIAVILGIVLSSLMLVVLLIQTVAILTNSQQMQQAGGPLSLCIPVVMVALVVLLLVWLVQAAKASKHVAAMKGWDQAQYWQQMQQHYPPMQPYGGQPMPPPPPPPPAGPEQPRG